MGPLIPQALAHLGHPRSSLSPLCGLRYFCYTGAQETSRTTAAKDRASAFRKQL